MCLSQSFSRRIRSAGADVSLTLRGSPVDVARVSVAQQCGVCLCTVLGVHVSVVRPK